MTRMANVYKDFASVDELQTRIKKLKNDLMV